MISDEEFEAMNKDELIQLNKNQVEGYNEIERILGLESDEDRSIEDLQEEIKRRIK